MDLGEYFRSFFGLGGRHRRDVPWNYDLYDDDDEEDGCSFDNPDNDTGGFSQEDNSKSEFFFGRGSHPLDDMFHHFHGDMNRQMEFLQRQMEDMMKGFGTIASEHFPPVYRRGPIDQPESHPIDGRDKSPFFYFNFRVPGQPNSNKDKNSPRDFMLKDDKEVLSPKVLPPSPAPPPDDSDRSRNGNIMSPFRRFFPWNQPSQHQREDTDLDGKISGSDVVDLIKKSNEEKTSQDLPSRGFFSGSSVSMTTVRGPDGKIEHKKVWRDSSGREESTITRTLDGQCHTVTTIKGPDGVEEKREDFKNMDQNDINKFEEKWQSHQLPQQPAKPSIIAPPKPHIIRPPPRMDAEDKEIWSKYFRDSPK